MIYLYAITDRPSAEEAPGPGLEDRPVSWLSHGSIGALVSALASAVQPTEANVWRHEAVVEAVMADCATLPVRFGTLFPDREALCAALTAHEGALVRDMETVRGRVELSLRALWNADDGPEPMRRGPLIEGANEPPTGKSYLLARLAEERRARERRQEAEALASQIHHPLAQLAVDSRRQLLLTPRLLLTSAYLVERTQVPAFGQQLEAVRTAHPQAQLLCTGPWPAYSFVTTTVGE